MRTKVSGKKRLTIIIVSLIVLLISLIFALYFITTIKIILTTKLIKAIIIKATE